MKKLLTALLTVAMLFSAFGTIPVQAKQSDDIVVLYTNDVHTYIDGPISYDVIAAIKAELETQSAHVLLVDAGDHIEVAVENGAQGFAGAGGAAVLCPGPGSVLGGHRDSWAKYRHTVAYATIYVRVLSLVKQKTCPADGALLPLQGAARLTMKKRRMRPTSFFWSCCGTDL